MTNLSITINNMAFNENEGTIDEKLQVEMNGPMGNAHGLLGIASKLHKKFSGVDTDLRNVTFEKIESDMKKSNYDNLVETFTDYFGEYTDLVY